MMPDSTSLARQVRRDVVRMHQKGSNIGSAMSAVDLLAVLYSDILRIPETDHPERDRFVLSKGHAAAALYATLAHRGFFETSLLEHFLEDDGPLTGHPSHGAVPGIDVSTGSLGQGLSVAIGLALAARHDGNPCRVYVLLGDGECQEGSVWEAALIAARLALDNLVMLVDVNGLQGYDRVEAVERGIPLAPRFESFGWSVRTVGGHDHDALRALLGSVPFDRGSPSVVLAQTVKGKGIREMENRLGWHYFSVSPEDLPRFLTELEDEE